MKLSYVTRFFIGVLAFISLSAPLGAMYTDRLGSGNTDRDEKFRRTIGRIKAGDVANVRRALQHTPDLAAAVDGADQNFLSIAIRNKKPDIVELLLQERSTNVNQLDKYGKTPLDYAKENQDDLVVALLESQGAVTGRRPARPAAEGAPQPQRLRTTTALFPDRWRAEDRRGIENLGEDANFRQTISATKNGKTDVVKNAVERRPEFALAEDSFGNTLLMFAAGAGNLELVEFLLQKGALINWPSTFMRTALDYALRAGHDNVVSFLERQDAHLYAKFFCTLKPSKHYRRWLAQTFESYRFPAQPKRVVSADELHVTLCAFAVPMKSYRATETANRYMNIIKEEVEQQLTRNEEAFNELITWNKITPIGRFIGVNFTTPWVIMNMMNSVYDTLLPQFPQARDTYEERISLHISIAEMEQRLDPETPLTQPVAPGWSLLRLDEDGKFLVEVSYNVPVFGGSEAAKGETTFTVYRSL